MNLRKKISVLLAVCMVISSIPFTAFAEEPVDTQIQEELVQEATKSEEKADVVTEKAEETAVEKATEKVEEAAEKKAEEISDIVLKATAEDGMIVILKADKDAFKNEGELSLVVTPVEIENTEEEKALDAIEKENVAKRVTYDITVLDDGEKIEPVKEVKVSFELKDAPSGADGVNIYHHDEKDGIEKIATEVLKKDAKEDTANVCETKTEETTKTDTGVDKEIEVKEVTDEELAETDDVELINDIKVVGKTDGFSLYTVDFTYEDMTISIAGDSNGNKLDDIVSQLGIDEKVEEATTYQDAKCTEEVANGEVKNEEGKTLFSVYESGDSWYVDAVNAFQTEHGLIVKTADGAEYKIKVTDAEDIGVGNYLTFTAQTNESSITFSYDSGTDVKYSKNGSNWEDCPSGKTISLDKNDTVSFKGTNIKTTYWNHFSMTGSIAASGDVTSLTNETGGDVALEDEYCYCYMFYGCSQLTTAPSLPSTTLVKGCYKDMFEGCTNLTTAPSLPATALARSCYESMFEDCTGLQTAPALPATALTKECYESMFKGCTDLQTAPALPTTALAESCYGSMFEDCTGLQTAPALPATALEESCYESMFEGCTGLQTAPALPATALAESCYESMFQGCTELTTVISLPVEELAESSCINMFWNCESLRVAEIAGNNQAAVGYMSFKCPDTSTLEKSVDDMFYGTTCLFVYGTPTAGNTYYSYTSIVSIDVNGGTTPGTVTTVYATKDMAMPALTGSMPTKTGHTFTGYFDAAIGGTKYYNADGTSAKDWDKTDSSTTLYAQWIANTYTVTFDMKGHGTQVESQTVAEGAKVDKPTDPTASGYAFYGWYKETECTNAWNFDTDTVSADTTLFAKWNSTPPVPTEYTITFDANGGSGTMPSMTTSGGRITLPANGFTAPVGKKFAGWGVGSKMGEAKAPGTEVIFVANSTVFAMWEDDKKPTPTPETKKETTVWTSVPTVTGSASAPVSNGSWTSTNGIFQYVVNGEPLRNATAWITYKGADGKQYTGCFYFDKSGNMAAGWQKIAGEWFFFDTTQGSGYGIMKTSGWIESNGKQYYVGADGKMLTNTTTPDGKRVGTDGARID